jgi:hypothetical protein
VEGHWYRNRNVDSDHANLDFVCELAGGVTVAAARDLIRLAMIVARDRAPTW